VNKPPSRWGRSRSGTYFYVIHSGKRDYRRCKLYRLKFLKVTSSKLWTFEELEEARVRWLKNKPKGF